MCQHRDALGFADAGMYLDQDAHHGFEGTLRILRLAGDLALWATLADVFPVPYAGRMDWDLV